MRTVRSTSGLAMLLLVAAGPLMAEELDLDREQRFDIGPQSLDSALLAFSDQANVQILVAANDIEGRQTQGIQGESSAREALDALLQATELVYTAKGSTIAVTASESEAEDLGNARTAPRPQGGEDVHRTDEGSQGPNDRITEEQNVEDPQFQKRIELEEIIVTGTNIRGLRESASPVKVITRENIARGGFSVVSQMTETLPQNFSGGPNEDILSIANGTNIAFGSSVDLRGLGADSTLTLLNGRRMAPAAFGDFVDISAIPLAAIERIEVLTDGASALYGSDAIGGVVNFILRKDFSGTESAVRLGTLEQGGGDEISVSQVFGRSWANGDMVLAYEFYDRDDVLTQDRTFTASYDKRPFGGDDFRNLQSFPGNVRLFDGSVYGIPSGQDGSALSEADLLAGQPNLSTHTMGSDLLPSQRRHSVFLSARQELTPRSELYFDGFYSDREAVNIARNVTASLLVPDTNYYRQANNLFLSEPFIFVDYNFYPETANGRNRAGARALNLTVGTQVRLAGDWQIDVGLNFGRNKDTSLQSGFIDTSLLADALASGDSATAFNPFVGTASNSRPILDAALTQFELFTRSEVLTARTVADGPILRLSGGPVRAALGAEYREEKYLPSGEGSNSGRRGSRGVGSVFGELFFPLVSSDNRRSGVERLEISAAVRYESYSDFGSSTNPKVGILWSPMSSLALRSTYGTSFKAPLFRELLGSKQVLAQTIPSIFDPRAATTPFVDAMFRFGGNPDLTAQKGTTWTVGFVYEPPFLARTRLELNYFSIEIEDRISSFTNLLEYFNNEEALTAEGIFARYPSQELIDRIVASGDDVEAIGGTMFQEGELELFFDLALQNIGTTELRGIDLDLGGDFATPVGRFDWTVGASYLTNFDVALISALPAFDRSDTFANPVDLRARAGATWSRNALRISAFVNYADDYLDNTLLPEREIDASTTVDTTFAYSWSDGLELILVGRNLLDDDPPFVNRPDGYDAANGDPSGRSWGVQLIKRW